MNYIIYGEEDYQIKNAVNGCIQKEIGTRDDMNTVVYSCYQSSLDVILADAQTISFFTEKKCILVEGADFLSSKDTTGYQLEPLLAYLKQPMESSVLIFTGNFAKLDMRKKAVKQISSLCKVIVCNRLDKNSLPVYVKEQLQKRRLTMSNHCFALLCERLPYDIGMIQSELDKLELCKQTIDEDLIQHLVTRSLEDDVFALVNAVVDKDAKKSFQIWNDLQVLNKDPIYLIALLSSQFHLLYQVKCALQQGMNRQDEIAAELGVHPYRVKLAMGICYRFTADDLLCVLASLADLDQAIKAGKVDKKLGFELFLLRLKGREL